MPKMVTKQMKTKLLYVSWIVTGSGIQISRPRKAQRFSAWRTIYSPFSAQRALWNHRTTTKAFAEWPHCVWMKGARIHSHLCYPEETPGICPVIQKHIWKEFTCLEPCLLNSKTSESTTKRSIIVIFSIAEAESFPTWAPWMRQIA